MKTTNLVRWVTKIARWVATAWKSLRWGWGPPEAASWKPVFDVRPQDEPHPRRAGRPVRRRRLCSSPVPLMPYA